MKVGLIADVHANLPALEAVIDDMPPVDSVVCAGDVVGYNPWPSACVDRVRDLVSQTVRGNHDATVDTPAKYRANRMAEAGLEHAKNALTAAQLEWLRSRPRTTRFGEDRYLLVHSHPSPDRDGTYVYPDAFPTLGPFLDADLTGVVLGHTHVQHADRTNDGRLVVNPGSVGQPRDGDPDAAYAVLDVTTDTVDLHRVPYDRDHVIDAIKATGLPAETGERLLTGT